MHHECKKILSCNVDISCTAVRVPVSIGHSASLSIQLEREFELSEIVHKLNAYPNVIVANNPVLNRYPMPLIAKMFSIDAYSLN